MPKISLILPLYNGVKYLRPCLDSVAAQTFKDFECLCINDGSIDDTEKIIKEYAKKDGRFVLFNKPNGGVSQARNIGLDAAGAPYVAFLDQDDMFHPQALEVLYFLIANYQTDASSFAFKRIPLDFTTLEKAPFYDPSKLKVKIIHDPLEDFFKTRRGGHVEIWTRLYKKAALNGIRFPKGVQPAEDTVFTLKVFSIFKSMAFVREKLLYYRTDHDTSVMTKGVTKKYFKSAYIAAVELWDTFLKDKDKNSRLYRRIEAYVSTLVFKTLITRILKRERSKRGEMLVLAHALALELYRKGVFLPVALSLRRRLVSLLFLKKHFKLARFVQM